MVRGDDREAARLGGPRAAEVGEDITVERPGCRLDLPRLARTNRAADLRVPLGRYSKDVGSEALEKVGDVEGREGAARVRDEQADRIGKLVRVLVEREADLRRGEALAELTEPVTRAQVEVQRASEGV